jgi:hypothetical protein
MAKYSQASESIERLVNDISNEMNLIHYGVDFQPLCVNKAKEVCKIIKANELAEYASNREGLVFVLCYEDAFDLVDEQTQYMWLRMEMEKVSYDTEKDKMIIGCPQITVPIGFYEKYKNTAVESALLGQYTIAQIEDKKKQEELERKALKKKNKKGE